MDTIRYIFPEPQASGDTGDNYQQKRNEYRKRSDKMQKLLGKTCVLECIKLDKT